MYCHLCSGARRAGGVTRRAKHDAAMRELFAIPSLNQESTPSPIVPLVRTVDKPTAATLLSDAILATVPSCDGPARPDLWTRLQTTNTNLPFLPDSGSPAGSPPCALHQSSTREMSTRDLGSFQTSYTDRVDAKKSRRDTISCSYVKSSQHRFESLMSSAMDGSLSSPSITHSSVNTGSKRSSALSSAMDGSAMDIRGSASPSCVMSAAPSSSLYTSSSASSPMPVKRIVASPSSRSPRDFGPPTDHVATHVSDHLPVRLLTSDELAALKTCHANDVRALQHGFSWDTHICTTLTPSERLHTKCGLQDTTWSECFAGVSSPGAALNDMVWSFNQQLPPDDQISYPPRCVHTTEWHAPLYKELSTAHRDDDSCQFGDVARFWADHVKSRLPQLKKNPRSIWPTLLPFVLDAANNVDLTAWCSRHKRPCTLQWSHRHIAGFPCTPHSSLGPKTGTDDACMLYTLAWAATVRALRYYQVIVENVDGVLYLLKALFGDMYDFDGTLLSPTHFGHDVERPRS